MKTQLKVDKSSAGNPHKRSILLTLAMALGVATSAVADFNVPENTVYDNSSSPAPKQEWVKIPKTSAFDLKTNSKTAKDLGYRVYIQGNGPDGKGALRDTGTVDPAADDKQLGYLELWAPSLIKSSRNMYLVNDGTGQGFQTWEHALTLDFAVGKSLTLINCCPWDRDGLITVISGGLTFGYRNGVSGEHNHQNRKIVVTGQNSWLKIVNPSWVYIKELEMSDGAKLVGDGNMVLHTGFKPAEAQTEWTGRFEIRSDGGTSGSSDPFKLDLSGLTTTWTFPSSYQINGITTRTFVVKPGSWATTGAGGEESKIIAWTTKPGSDIEFVADTSATPKGWSVEPRADGLYLVNSATPPTYAYYDTNARKWIWYTATWQPMADDDPGLPTPPVPTAKQIVYFNNLAQYNYLAAQKGNYGFKELQMRGGTWSLNSDTDLSGLDFVIADVGKINLGYNARLKMTGKSASQAPNGGWAYPNNSSKAVVELTVPEGETATFNGAGYYIGGEAGDNQNLQMEKTGKGRLQIDNFELGPNVYPAWVVKEGVLAKTGGKMAFGRQNTTVRVNDGAQVDLGDREYWDYDYEIAGNGPDGTGALTASKVFDKEGQGLLDSTKHIGCLHNLTLTADASVDAPAGKPWPLSFWANDNHNVTFNGHTLTLGMTECVYWINLRPTDAGKLVIGKSEVYNCWTPWGETEARIDDAHPQFIDMSKVDIEVKTELVANSGCFFSPIKSLKFDSAASWRHSSPPAAGEYFEVVVHETYRPSPNKMPQITLGAEGHTTPTLDLSTLTDALDGTHLGFYAGSTVTVDVGQRDLTQSQKLVSWTTRPTNVSFKLMSKSGSYRAEVRDDGLYASSGVIVIFK